MTTSSIIGGMKLYNTLNKPREMRLVIYWRVATEAQIITNKSIVKKSEVDIVHITIKNQKSPYILPRQLMKPKYNYQTRFNVHNIIKANSATPQFARKGNDLS
jgi:hypothetical protein